MPLTERALIDRIRLVAGRTSRTLLRGIGDDCALLKLPPRHEALVTTDFCLENVHFRREWHPARAVGHRCLVRGLSDIAAMGGRPIAAFLSLALSRGTPQRWVDEFLKGFLALADHWKTSLAGGDIAQSPDGILADVIVLGSVPRGKAVLRSGARAGDLIYVTGTLGLSVLALNRLRSGQKLGPRQAPRHFFPQPRIDVGEQLRSTASSMIDLSDGLSTDLSHICEESGTGAVIYASSIPHPGGADGLGLALNGGEDYELLFTAPAGRRVPARIVDIPISLIGEIVRPKGIWLAAPDGRRSALPPGGWEHFRE